MIPNYENSIAGIPNSIMKYFGVSPQGATLPQLDQMLEKEKYENIVVLLLDGFGKSVIEANLKPDGFFRSHMSGTISACFPSTTASGTASLRSGLQPCGHAHLGRRNYYEQLDKTIDVFSNTDVDGEPAANYDVANTLTLYRTVQNRLEETGKKAYVLSPFEFPYAPSFEAICNAIGNLCEEPGDKFIFAYWPEPDSVIHRYGCTGKRTKQVLMDLEEQLEAVCKQQFDTLFIVTADHGFVDCRGVCIEDYPDIMECLERMPTTEARAMNLFVKDGMKAQFEEMFKRHFENDYLLLTKEEVLERKLFGTDPEHECFRSMLGDYLAVAVGHLAIYNTQDEAKQYVAHHGGLTKEEMEVPFITFDHQEDLKEFLKMFWGETKASQAVIDIADERFNLK